MEANKNTIGQVFFALSILMLIYMLISPLNQVLSNISEFFTLTLINFPMSDLLHILGGETNPPLYFLLLKAMSKLTNDFAILKVFSAIPYAIILILSTLKLRRDYGWLTAGLFAFALAVMSEFLITYSILRPYSWAMLFTLLAFIFFKDIISNADKKSFILFTVFSILASYTHYYGLIATIVLYLILLFHILCPFSTNYLVFKFQVYRFVFVPTVFRKALLVEGLQVLEFLVHIVDGAENYGVVAHSRHQLNLFFLVDVNLLNLRLPEPVAVDESHQPEQVGQKLAGRLVGAGPAAQKVLAHVVHIRLVQVAVHHNHVRRVLLAQRHHLSVGVNVVAVAVGVDDAHNWLPLLNAYANLAVHRAVHLGLFYRFVVVDEQVLKVVDVHRVHQRADELQVFVLDGLAHVGLGYEFVVGVVADAH